MSNDSDDEIDKAQIAANEEAIEMIRDRFDRIEDQLQVLFRGDNGSSKVTEIEKNKTLREEIKNEGLIEMVKTNRKMIEMLRDDIAFMRRIILASFGVLLTVSGTTLWYIIQHVQ